jgi:hypothetical protein
MKKALLCIDKAYNYDLEVGNFYFDYTEAIDNRGEGEHGWIITDQRMTSGPTFFYKIRFIEVPAPRLVRLLFE